MTDANHILYRSEFPRSNSYDPNWVMDNQMGPNALWLIEWLCREMDLKPGMRVLDLGCGTAMTSIFLAREFDVRVWAADLWVNPDANWERVRGAGVGDRVCPLRAEAHALPFAKDFFDAAVSVDAYQYFGTDELYLGYLSHFVRPQGTIGIVVPGLMRPFKEGIPQHLTRKQSNGHSFWEDDCISFLTMQRWRDLWERSNRVEVAAADEMPDGWKHWRDFENELERAGKNHPFPSVVETLDVDQGQYIGFVRLVGIRNDRSGAANLYDPASIAQLVSGTG